MTAGSDMRIGSIRGSNWLLHRYTAATWAARPDFWKSVCEPMVTCAPRTAPTINRRGRYTLNTSTAESLHATLSCLRLCRNDLDHARERGPGFQEARPHR